MVLEGITGMITGIIESSTGMFLDFMQLNTALAVGFLFILILMAYKIFKIALKAVVVGILSSLIPVVAVIMGINIGLAVTLNNMAWFAIMGIATYLVYISVNMGVRTVRLIMKPFSLLFRNKAKKKVIIKEIKEED